MSDQAERMLRNLKRPMTRDMELEQRRAWSKLTPEERERLIPTDAEQIEVVSGGKKS